MAGEQSLEITVARQGERLEDLENSFEKHESKQNGSMEKIWKKLDEMSRRPTWPVSLSITTLVGLVIAMGMALMRK